MTLLQTTSKWARGVVEVASEKQASDIHLLDMTAVCSFTDFFVIMSANSRRHIVTVAVEVEKALSQSGVGLHHMEGDAASGWVLMDFGDMLVHIFGPDERAYYQLDQVWSTAVSVVRIQ